MSAVLSLRGVCKRFGDKVVLSDLSLDLHEGESLVIIGQSGAGKSVLLRAILGLDMLDRGEIFWRGAPLDGRRREEFLADFGMLFQGAALFDSLPVWQNVSFKLRRGPRDEARARAIAALGRVGLAPEIADAYPADLSGGMAKRVGLARAIAANPSLIFFDEPTTGLDPVRADGINRLIREIQAETRASAITITHDLSSVRAIADRVVLLDQGAIRWQGRVDEMATAADPLLRAFLDAGQ